jgi:hypothetical protein
MDTMCASLEFKLHPTTPPLRFHSTMQLSTADVPDAAPGIGFAYYKSVLPEEFHHIVADAEVSINLIIFWRWKIH